jgi:hypothetical protein
VLLTNHLKLEPLEMVTRYAQRMLIENGISEAVQFFHIDARCSMVGMKLDFDLREPTIPILVASGLAVFSERGAVSSFDDVYGHDKSLDAVLEHGYPYSGWQPPVTGRGWLALVRCERRAVSARSRRNRSR